VAQIRDHAKADAYDLARGAINLELRRYARRLKAAAEAHIEETWSRAAASGLPFDHKASADDAVAHARSLYFAADLPQSDPIEVGPGASDAA
jgi:hypothetical protein